MLENFWISHAQHNSLATSSTVPRVPSTIYRPIQPCRSTLSVRCYDRRELPSDGRRRLTPSTTSNSPQTYWLALLAKNTMGPAKSWGCPHLPAGIRSEICLNRTGSARSFSFLAIETSVRKIVRGTDGTDPEEDLRWCKKDKEACEAMCSLPIDQPQDFAHESLLYVINGNITSTLRN